MSKVLVVVTSSFPIRHDGSEAAGSFVADMVEALTAHMEVRVVAPGLRVAREVWSEKVSVYRYTAPSKPLSTLKPWRVHDLGWIVRILRSGLVATRDAVADDSAHILALWGLPCGEWARRVAQERGIAYSTWLLGSDVWSLGRLMLVRSVLAKVMRDAAHVYADGYVLAADAEKIGKVPVGFLPSTRRIGLVATELPCNVAPFRLLFLGRWHPNKGVDLLLDALDALDDADWQRIERVQIQGGGPLEGLVRQRVAALQELGRPVWSGGYLAKDEAEAAIATADWVLIPSRIESIPVVFSDAMKLGRPVVAMPVGDLPRLIEEHPCGVVAKEVSALALKVALCVALSASTSSFASGINCHAARFDLARIADGIVKDFSNG